MIKNYLKTAWRNLRKNGFYTVINITGLATGLAAGIMILLWVQDELSFDRFHKKLDHIYKLVSHIGTGTSSQVWGSSPAPDAAYGKKEIPGIVNAVRIRQDGRYAVLKYQDKEFTEFASAYTDPSFFTVFSFRLLTGNPANPFPNDQSVIITASTARKFFGTENPIGKVIVANSKDNYTVNGIIEDFPENSSIRYDILFPLTIVAKGYDGKGYWKAMDEDWGNYMYSTFFELSPNAPQEAVAQKMTQIHHGHQQEAKDNFYSLQPMEKLHLYEPDGSSAAMQTVRIFLTVAIFILLIACINYVNLSTARSILRSKEVSVRKIIGAAKMQLFIQFILESVIIFLFSVLAAFIFIRLLIPFYNSITGKQLVFSLFNRQVLFITGITIVATLAAAGVYPALLLCSFKPALALKGKISFGIGNASFRKVLVVTQFSISVALIIGTIIINRQLQFIREKELGFDKSYVFSFNMRGMQSHYEAVRAELMRQPGITGVATASSNIVVIGNSTADTDWDGKQPNSTFLIHPMGIDKDFMPLIKLQLAAGDNFGGSATDSAHFILNETAVRETGIKDPIGKSFTLWQTKGTITGVVKDFHFNSLKQKIEPSIFYYDPANWMINIRTTGKDAPRAIAAAGKLWKQYNAGLPFHYTFLDETYDKLYKSDQRTGLLSRVFAIVTIFISCLGLLGLATYTAQTKIKEIGIRKVLGASLANITHLLAKDFIRLVIIAIIIATPVSWYLMNKWLQVFAYRTHINGWIFAMAAVSAVVIALLTISFQSVKAALANPVKSLRSE